MFKTYDWMDVSHRIAYKLGRADAVANPNIEAVAILICESVFGEDWDGEIPLVQLNQAKRYVVAALTPPEDTPT